jgi:electron transfer flavoprotein-quinone oxidoreductase
LAKEAGLYPHAGAEHFTLGAKEVLGLPRAEIDKRFALSGDEGADYEIVGATGDVPGGAFLYTNADSISIGVVLSLPELGRSGRRPEEFIADLKAHPAIAPLVAGAELKEYSAHLIPEGGYDAMPEIVTDGMLVAGDAAGLCLAAGIWLEGVNFAIASGAAAGETAIEALAANNTSAGGLAGYRRRLEVNFVLRDHKKLRRAPGFVLSRRVQQTYPQLLCDVVEQLFTVTNPRPKVGGLRAVVAEMRKTELRISQLARDAVVAIRTFG